MTGMCCWTRVLKSQCLSVRTYFIFIEPSAAPMIISGVNPEGNPLVITECGETDFGFAYYYPKCTANIQSFGNVVNSSESVVYNSRHDC